MSVILNRQWLFFFIHILSVIIVFAMTQTIKTLMQNTGDVNQTSKDLFAGLFKQVSFTK